MRQRGGEDGFTLVEVLLAGALMVVVLFGVLGAADVFSTRARANTELTQAQESARATVDRITRELRSAGPGGGATALLRTQPADLVFATDRAVDAQGQWRAVRYCWDGADLHRQLSSAGTITVPGAPCPQAGWGADAAVARGLEGPPFAMSSSGAGATTVAVDIDPVGAPPLHSAVTVRNRAFDADEVRCTVTGSGTAMLDLGVGVGQMLQIPLAFADLLGLRSLLFGAAPPPAGWQCP